MTVYILSMERYGDRDGHHYNCGVFADLAVAAIMGLEHESFRANKYEMRIELAVVESLGDSSKAISEIPREVAINYAVMSFPDRFDDKKNLKEET